MRSPLARHAPAAFVAALLFVLSCSAPRCNGQTVLLGSFNVQQFGTSFMSVPAQVEVLRRVMLRYDIMLLMEVQDVSGTAILNMLAVVNANNTRPFSLSLSPRLGRTSNREQYAFFFRNDTVRVRGEYVFNDTADVFEREPYVAIVDVGSLTFTAIAIHTRPDAAVAEIDALADVYADSVRATGVVQSLILGDLNADCSYVSAAARSRIRLFNSSDFVSLIDNSVDTTVSLTTNCSYDRFFTAGGLEAHVVNDSAQVFRFDLEYNLTNAFARNVSDHFPIELRLLSDTATSGATPRVARSPQLLASLFAFALFMGFAFA
jgi:endonuclease/exonuclease/phosphatase family metal-dependent hydrolase